MIKAVAQAGFVKVDELPPSERGLGRLRPQRALGPEVDTAVPELPEVEALALFVTEQAGGSDDRARRAGLAVCPEDLRPPLDALVGRTVSHAERTGEVPLHRSWRALAGGAPGEGGLAPLA